MRSKKCPEDIFRAGTEANLPRRAISGERRINSSEQELSNYPDAQQKMSRGHF
jgi:hypothetical protein